VSATQAVDAVEETRVVDERMQFIAAVLDDPQGNFTRLCAQFGISRNKG
jgi:hypothetical protein